MKKLKDIKEKQRKQAVIYAVTGGIIIAAILFATMAWVSNKARNSTNLAVSRVSDFYLEELAGRRAQVVSEELNTHLTYIENALTVLEDSDLESQETLREFLGKVKMLYGVDMFGLVDENGTVYTEQSASSGLDGYDFLTEELTGPVINTTNLEGERKRAVLAAPVENISFQGVQITVCFIQINIDEMLSYRRTTTRHTAACIIGMERICPIMILEISKREPIFFLRFRMRRSMTGTVMNR